LVAIDRERRWLLLRAAAGRKLEEIGTLDAWERAARTYGQLQMASRAQTDALRACGAVERDLDLLLRGLDLLGGEHQALRAALPNLRRRAAQLAAYEIPLMLEHGDL